MSLAIFEALDLLAVVVFALSGATLGIRKQLDIYGVAVLGFATALGGGVIRDVLLGVPPFTLTTTIYPTLAILSSCTLYWVRPSWLLRINRLMSIFDAIGLGLVAATTTAKALDHAVFPWLTCVILGGIAGSGGGMIRDVLAAEIPLVLRPGEPYATAALAGGLMVVGLRQVEGFPSDALLWIGAATTTGIRLFSLKYNLRFPPARPL